MYSAPSLSSTLALLASIVPSVVGQYDPNCAYFVQYTAGYLVTERIDPLLSPGVVSNHVHSITGGDGFKTDMTFADTQASTCTTAEVSQDKSNYWMPVLYFHDKGTYRRVPEANNRKIYYKYGNSDCSTDTSRSEFPEGFRMMTGSATQRVENATMMGTAGNQMEWQCHDGASNPKATGFPTGFQSCNAEYVPGLAAAMRFPSCWNGNEFDKNAPMAHMAFPTNKDGLEGCPAPFNKARFPEIFIEYYFDISSFDNIPKDYSDPNNPPWVLADGDPTGFSFHMDFLNGWTPGTLKKAMGTCAIAGAGSDAAKKTGLASDACFGVKSATNEGYQSRAEMDKCTLASVVSEDIGLTGTSLNALPGCNPIQSGPQPATIYAPSTCGALSELNGGSVPAPNAQSASPDTATSTTAVASSTSGLVGGTDRPASRAVTSPETDEVPATPSSSNPTEPSTSGSGGSPGSIAVSGPSGSQTWTYQGCYTDLTPDRNTRSLANWGSGQSSTDCANHCFSAGLSIAGTENGAQCFCGNTMTSTTKMADSDCNQACVGNSSEICGGGSRLSVYAKDGTALTKRSLHLHRHAVRHAGSF